MTTSFKLVYVSMAPRAVVWSVPEPMAGHHWPTPPPETFGHSQANLLLLLYWLHWSLWLWITKNCWKFFKRREYWTTLPAYWEICIQVKKQQLELHGEQQTGSKSGKEYIKAVYCHPAYLTYMQSTSSEIPGWMKDKLESRFQGEISITSDIQMTPPYGKKQRRSKKPLDESERGQWKTWLKTQHSEN